MRDRSIVKIMAGEEDGRGGRGDSVGRVAEVAGLEKVMSLAGVAGVEEAIGLEGETRLTLVAGRDDIVES